MIKIKKYSYTYFLTHLFMLVLFNVVFNIFKTQTIIHF